ncbi:MAG: hypothetical protein ACXAD7_26225 [Candidatus Kariarchaeaceae archaeon]|jgi:hypothetical protein
MKTWEYCAIRVNIDDDKKFLKYFDTSEHKVVNIKDAHTAIAELGSDGWEMVNLAELSNPNARVYYFKRMHVTP